MTAREDIKAFVASDIPSRITASLTLPAADSYLGQQRRINEADFEIRTRFLTRDRLRRDSGLTRHTLDIEVLSIGWDESEEDNLAEQVEDVGELLVDAYDGSINLFQTNLANVQVERVRCLRAEPLSLELKQYRWARIVLEVDELEA